MRLLSPGERERGVVTASTGNHGHAVALAARKAGVPVSVFAAKKTAPSKLAAIRAHGADLHVIDGVELEAELSARAEADRSGRCYISPYNDMDVMAGQGTLGIELAEAGHRLDAVFVSVGGGGLIGGIGTALSHLSPSTQIIGCWPENSPVLLRALEAGFIHDVPESETISDGTAGALEPGTVTLPVCAEVIDQYVTVSEGLIKSAMWALADHEHWMVEGAAGVALAGLAALKAEMEGKTVAVILCGRNIGADTFASALAQRPQAPFMKAVEK
ncbi:pyridoxal-phosphate dependent enzyme [Rhizobium sp. PP-CC-3G-465]|uniref:pyridoxal-phosphate dependent enzyme n=1 Tax=Rhizobium sp. PP-CC-3G-465 TaxID=2135648 RepID=UPI001A9EA958